MIRVISLTYLSNFSLYRPNCALFVPTCTFLSAYIPFLRQRSALFADTYALFAPTLVLFFSIWALFVCAFLSLTVPCPSMMCFVHTISAHLVLSCAVFIFMCAIFVPNMSLRLHMGFFYFRGMPYLPPLVVPFRTQMCPFCSNLLL